MSIAWSPRGDALLAALTGNEPDSRRVVRFVVR